MATRVNLTALASLTAIPRWLVMVSAPPSATRCCIWERWQLTRARLCTQWLGRMRLCAQQSHGWMCLCTMVAFWLHGFMECIWLYCVADDLGNNACLLTARPPLIARESRGHSPQHASFYRFQPRQCQVLHSLQGCGIDAPAQPATLEAGPAGGAGSSVPGGHQCGTGQAVSQCKLNADLQQLLRAGNYQISTTA